MGGSSWRIHKLSTDQEITIYILSSSNSEEDLERAKQYEKIKNYYIKPIELSQMKILLQHVTAINLANLIITNM